MRYIRLFAVQCKLSVMAAAMFRMNFWLMFIQSLVNSAAGILSIEFIYGSVDTIAGWGKHEMIILICTSLMVNQLFRGFIHFNQNRFIGSVGNGSFDRMLLRPVSIVFQTGTGSVDMSCILSVLGPLVVLLIQMSLVGAGVTILQVALYILFVLNGVLILSSFMLLLYSAAFLFVKVDGMTDLYYLIMDIADKPKEMFAREFMYGFIFVIPAIPLANAPASVLLGKSDLPMMLIYLFVGMIFAAASCLSIRMGLRRYTSASS